MVVVDCCAGGLAAVVDVAASGVSWGSVVAHCPMRGWCGVLEEFVGALSGDCTCASEYFGFSFSGRLMFFVCVRIAAQEETGAQIDIDRDNNTVTIRGSNPDGVAQCKEKIEKIIEEAHAARGGGDRTGEDGATEKKFKVDKGVIPALLGSGASVIQRIEADSGASVRIDRVRAVHCRGGTFFLVSPSASSLW